MKRTDSDRILAIQEHLAVLHRHLARGELEDELVFDAVCQRLAAAIEEADRLDPSLVKGEFKDEWKLIKATRNAIAHSYAFIDVMLIQNTISRDLVRFETGIEQIAKTMRNSI